MAGLIPLMLASSTRTSSDTASQLSSRRQSTAMISPTRTEPPRMRSPKRLSLYPPEPLPTLPDTKAEWKAIIAEVKKEYFAKRYRACSSRCLEVLGAVKDSSQVDPVYLIYLHFYAATSMEICARPLPSSSSLRTSLLKQARTHFDRAGSLISAAEKSVVARFRPYSATPSSSSACHSPAVSVSSQAWTSDTRVSSPTTSVFSFEDLSPRGQPPVKRVKKVSFSLPDNESIQMPEPIIRPDSPTLGFDDAYFQAGATRQALPDLPMPPPPPKFQEIELPLQTIPEDASESEPTSPPPTPSSSDEYDGHAFQVARSIDRCCEHLSGLRTQLVRHSTSLDQLLSASSFSPTDQQQQQQRDNLAGQPGKASSSSSSAEELRALDRRARIERLRKCGWQRKRFDARRYEELCEAAMAELN